jgi:hypothetical protein
MPKVKKAAPIEGPEGKGFVGGSLIMVKYWLKAHEAEPSQLAPTAR